MAFKDNREYISALKQAGEVVFIEKEVDWDLEAGAIVRRAQELRTPAPFFLKIKDYPEGYRILGAPYASYRRAAIAMGLDPDVHPSVIIEEFSNRLENPIKPIIVKNGPCQDNVILEDDVDVYKFPAPMIHDGDGGRYISSWHFIVVKDPDSDWVNWGMYRQMIHNHRTLTGLCLPYSDQGRIFYGKYVPKNQPMPFATVIGPDPLCAHMAMSPMGIGVSEVNLAGALRKEPVELVKCITSDLYVPAHAEIIIEGEVLPNALVEEGPFGEFTGYRSGPRMPRSVYRIKAITHRNYPILTMSNMGTPVDDCDIGMSICWSAEIKKLLETQGIQVTGVYCPPEFVAILPIIGIKKQYSNMATQIGNIIYGSKYAGPWIHMIIVVDDDIDPFNLPEVLHAFGTKCHPSRGIRIQEQAVGNPLAPYLSLEERKWSLGAKVVFDCTWPLNWSRENEIPPKVSFNNVYPEDVQQKVIENWESYGYK